MDKPKVLLDVITCKTIWINCITPSNSLFQCLLQYLHYLDFSAISPAINLLESELETFCKKTVQNWGSKRLWQVFCKQSPAIVSLQTISCNWNARRFADIAVTWEDSYVPNGFFTTVCLIISLILYTYLIYIYVPKICKN